MIRLELSERQAEALTEALGSYLSDLRMEISHTDSMEFRERLKTRKQLLSEVEAGLLEKAPTAVSP